MGDELEWVKIICQERKYRHGVFWNSVYKWGTAIVIVSVVPYVKPDVIPKIARAVLVFPVLGFFMLKPFLRWCITDGRHLQDERRDNARRLWAAIFTGPFPAFVEWNPVLKDYVEDANAYFNWCASQTEKRSQGCERRVIPIQQSEPEQTHSSKTSFSGPPRPACLTGPPVHYQARELKRRTQKSHCRCL